MGLPVSQRSVIALQYISPDNVAGWVLGWRDIYDPTYNRTDLPAPENGLVPKEFSMVLSAEGFDVVLSHKGVIYAARKGSL
jgi:hypothetical protein